MLSHFRNDIMHGDPNILALELTAALKGWVLLHIQGEDKLCGAFLNREASRKNWKEETFRAAA